MLALSRRLAILAPATACFCLAPPCQGTMPLAEYVDGIVTVGDVRAQWDVLRIPDEAVLQTLLASVLSPEEVDDPAALRLALEAVTESLVSDRLLWASLEPSSEETAIVAQRALERITERHRADLVSHLADEGPVSRERWTEALEERRAAHSVPERRAGRLIVLVGEDHAARAEAIRERIEAGEGFATLAEQHSQGPGWSLGGAIGPWTQGEAPWPALADALFDAVPEDGLQVIPGDEISLILEVERVFPGREATREMIWEAEERDLRAEQGEFRRRVEIENLIQRWDATPAAWERSVASIPDAKARAEFQRLAMEAEVPDQEMLRRVAEAELIARLFRERECEARWLACLGAEAREVLWGNLVTSEEISEESIVGLVSEIAQSPRSTAPALHRLAVIRLMPSPLGVPSTPASLSRWRGLDARATALRASLEREIAEGHLLSRAIEAIDSRIPEKVEMLEMRPTSSPPAFLGAAAFANLGVGQVSEVIAPREDVRLLYTLLSIEPATLVPWEEMRSQALDVALTQERNAAMESLTEGLLREASFNSLISSDEASTEANQP